MTDRDGLRDRLDAIEDAAGETETMMVRFPGVDHYDPVAIEVREADL